MLNTQERIHTGDVSFSPFTPAVMLQNISFAEMEIIEYSRKRLLLRQGVKAM